MFLLVLNVALFSSMIWTLDREEAAGGGEVGRGEEELWTDNFGEDNRSETSRKWTKEKFKIMMVPFFVCFFKEN